MPRSGRFAYKLKRREIGNKPRSVLQEAAVFSKSGGRDRAPLGNALGKKHLAGEVIDKSNERGENTACRSLI